MARLKTKKQLERKYAQEIKDAYCVDYFDFILYCTINSSEPERTFKDWFQELNKAGRKEFIQEGLNMIEEYGRRHLSWAVKYL